MPPKSTVLTGSTAAPALDLPGPGPDQARILIIASQPRCGSHMLGQMLMADGRFGVPLEYFHKRHWPDWVARVRQEQQAGDLSPARVFAGISRARQSAQGIVSLKAHWHQFAPMLNTDLAPLLMTARYVCLRRRDTLAQAISYQIALQTGAWVSDMANKAEPDYDSTAIKNHMTTILHEREAWDAFLASHALPSIPIDYEEMDANPGQALNSIAEFFDLQSIYDSDHAPIMPTLRQSSQINAEWKRRYLQEQEAG